MNHLVAHLRAHGERAARCTPVERTLSYRQLADEVECATAAFAGDRKLILLETAQRYRHPGALSRRHGWRARRTAGAARQRSHRPAGHLPARCRRSTPAVHHRGAQHHDLHLDLAPAAVHVRQHRLTQTGPAVGGQSAGQRRIHRRVPRDPRYRLRGNDTTDVRTVTGCRSIHSHLLRGAALILTDLSVIDDAFWELFGRHRGTSFAGVPYTFELLDRIGFDDHEPAAPALRHPGRRTTGTRTGAPVRRARAAPGLAAVRHVRRHRGHRPNGVPATGTRRPPGRPRSAGPSPAGGCDRSRRATTESADGGASANSSITGPT